MMRGGRRRLCQCSLTLLLIFLVLQVLAHWKSSTQQDDGKEKRRRLLRNLHDTSEEFVANFTSLRLYEQFQSKPFSEGSPKMVVVMTYQRSGSSFFGEIFDRNPGAFYVYEPLDSLFTSLYGTSEGWNVPSDITSYWNGTERVPPQDEIDAVAGFLDHLLSCRTDALPTEFFRHRYWASMTKSFQSGQLAYRSCMRELRKNLYKCSNMLPNVTCPKRIGEDWERLTRCKEQLRSTFSTNTHIQMYKTCNKQVRQELEACIPILTKNCSNAEVRATKTVRATLASMETLLSLNPDVRIIYLVRDPRAVVFSRMKYYSSRGSYSKDDYVREAKIFCRTATRDLKLLKVLQDVHPGRIIQVIYDDFVKDPLEYTKAIYNFLGLKIPTPTMEWLVTNTQVKKNSTVIATRWQSKVPYRNVLYINKYCEDYMKEIKYPWY